MAGGPWLPLAALGPDQALDLERGVATGAAARAPKGRARERAYFPKSQNSLPSGSRKRHFQPQS